MRRRRSSLGAQSSGPEFHSALRGWCVRKACAPVRAESSRRAAACGRRPHPFAYSSGVYGQANSAERSQVQSRPTSRCTRPRPVRWPGAEAPRALPTASAALSACVGSRTGERHGRWADDGLARAGSLIGFLPPGGRTGRSEQESTTFVCATSSSARFRSLRSRHINRPMSPEARAPFCHAVSAEGYAPKNHAGRAVTRTEITSALT